jgi:hypothetical protein
MQMIRAAEAGFAQVEAIEELQHLEGADSLAVGREFPDIVAAVFDAERLDPFRFVLSQVFVAKEAAVFAHEGVEPAGNFAAIEGISATGGDCFQSCGECRIAKCFAVLRRTATW